jgi:hypothetical protein
MSRAPDSQATRHSLNSVQRQYIDSRITEKTIDFIHELREENKALKNALAANKTALTTLAIRIANLEEFVRDDRPHQNPLNSPENNSSIRSN